MPYVAHPQDVILVVKMHVWTAAMAQQPMVILPYALRDAAGPIPIAMRAPNPPKSAAEWIAPAAGIEALYLDDDASNRAVAYLRALANGSRGWAPVPPLPWHAAAAN